MNYPFKDEIVEIKDFFIMENSKYIEILLLVEVFGLLPEQFLLSIEYHQNTNFINLGPIFLKLDSSTFKSFSLLERENIGSECKMMIIVLQSPEKLIFTQYSQNTLKVIFFCLPYSYFAKLKEIRRI